MATWVTLNLKFVEPAKARVTRNKKREKENGGRRGSKEIAGKKEGEE